MKQKPDLSALQNADMQTIEQISAHCPAASEQELDRIYAASERKYQGQKPDNTVMSDAEVYDVIVEHRSPVWKRTWAAAACLLVCAGTFGGMYALNRYTLPEEQLTAEVDSITENADRTVSPDKENEDDNSPVEAPEIVHDGQSASAVTKEASGSENADAAQNVDVSQNTGTVQNSGSTKPGTVIHPESSVKTDVTEAPSEAPGENDIIPEENALYKTSLSGVTFGESFAITEEEAIANGGIPEIPGFTSRVGESEIYGYKSGTVRCTVISNNLNGAAERIVTGHIPSYLPEGMSPRESYSDENSVFYNLEDGVWKFMYMIYLDSDEQHILVEQRVKRQFVDGMSGWEDSDTRFTPVTIDGRPGYIKECFIQSDLYSTTLVWDAGEFIYTAEMPTSCVTGDYLDEAIKILRSMQPRDKSNDPVAVNLPEVPGFTVASEWWKDGGQNLWKITAGSSAGAPATIQTKYAPTYVPQGIYQAPEDDRTQYIYNCIYEEHAALGMNYCYWLLYYQDDSAKTNSYPFGNNPIWFSQSTKQESYSFVRFETGSTVTPITVGGRPGYLYDHFVDGGINSDTIHHRLIWDGGDYIFTIKLTEFLEAPVNFNDGWLDEIIKMAESVQPVN